jgi:hypothetical protein
VPDSWKDIVLSAKVFGHLSQGLYRTPAGAIKELISNSFDADATLVRIHTGFPRFETFSCEDNGHGMELAEFERLMHRGIGTSYKRVSSATLTEVNHRPMIGRLGLGILSLAQICTQFDVISHHERTATAFRATIKFPPYTQQEMDRITQRLSTTPDGDDIRGGEYQIHSEPYDPERRGLRIFTAHLRESFRKRMRSLQRLANRQRFGDGGPYKTFGTYLDAIYNPDKPTASTNLLSDYDQLLFGLALAPPLPLLDDRNIAVSLPSVSSRQTRLRGFDFEVQVDNLALANPVSLPWDREHHIAKGCVPAGAEACSFELHDGAATERCSVVQHILEVAESDLRFSLYELSYSNQRVAGSPLEFDGYLFQQTGRLYPRDIQGVLIRINDVAIGKYDNSMLTYPLAEGPRYSMVSSELFVKKGFEDALNIDRDSFNELHPHYMRLQSYLHGLLGRVFSETWTEEKQRNKARRDRAAEARNSSFVKQYRAATGEEVRTIRPVEARPRQVSASSTASPVRFGSRRGEIEVDRGHPLFGSALRRRKYASLVDKIVVAFERANQEPSAARRRELFYRLLNDIVSEL